MSLLGSMCRLFAQGRENGLGQSSDANRSVPKGILHCVLVFYLHPGPSGAATLLPSPGSDSTSKARLWDETPEARAGVDPGRCRSQEAGAEGRDCLVYCYFKKTLGSGRLVFLLSPGIFLLCKKGNLSPCPSLHRWETDPPLWGE